MTHSEICEQLFSAFTQGNADTVRQLCAPNLQSVQNGGPTMNLETLLGFTMAVLGVVKDFRYEDVYRTTTETGFVEGHMVRGTLPDGSDLNIAACVIGDVTDGKITQLQEYVDSAAAAGLIAALSS